MTASFEKSQQISVFDAFDVRGASEARDAHDACDMPDILPNLFVRE